MFGCAAIASIDAAVMVNEVVFVVVGGYAEVGFDFGLFGVADVGLVGKGCGAFWSHLAFVRIGSCLGDQNTPYRFEMRTHPTTTVLR